MANYGRKLRIGADIRRKEKVTEFAKRTKKILEEAEVMLRKL